jgi:hypothetical protein
MEKEKREVEPKCKHCEYTTKNLTCMKDKKNMYQRIKQEAI